jgi:hypothetical protein
MRKVILLVGLCIGAIAGTIVYKVENGFKSIYHSFF